MYSRHARSREGKLQVELAQLRYRQSNLIGSGADLSRLGGGIGTRGPGETKLEVDRRRIQSRITVLRKQLETVRRQRETRRSAPHEEPLVALVGYTNVGKSSLLNALARGDAFVADQPFATLDPTIRRVYLNDTSSIRLADTVGFITDLPKDLITAFRATLEELRDADLLVHVLDASNPDWPRQREAVETILHDLELDAKPRLLAFNKTDAAPGGVAPEAGALSLSARTGAGLDTLRAALVAVQKVSLALVCALAFLASGCASSNPDDRFVALVQRMKPSVVLLSMRVPSEDKKHGMDDEFATGFVIASGDWGSDILSVAHAVDGASNIAATISNKTKVPVSVIAVDKDLDISLLRTTRRRLPTLRFGSSEKLRTELGRDVGLLGYPVPDEFQDSDLGLETSLSAGRLSSIRKDALELTMPIVPGESGAPIFVIDSGELVGMAEARFDDEHSIGFALPIDDVKRFLHAHDAAHGF